MKTLLCAVFWGVFLTIMAKQSPPKVQVYSRYPGFHDQDNVLICHVSGFQPPEIQIELVRDNKEVLAANQTDLAFEDTWQFHLTKSARVKPAPGDSYACRVTHQGKMKQYDWELDV